MFRCSRPLASTGPVWTQRSRPLFATDPCPPVQPGDPSPKRGWERTIRTLREVSLRVLPRPHGKKRSHWRGSGLADNLRLKSTAAVSWDALNGHPVSTAFSPFLVPVQRAVRSECPPLPQDPGQATSATTGTQTCRIPLSRDHWNGTLSEQPSLTDRPKPAHADPSKRLSEGPLAAGSLGSTAISARDHAIGVRNVCGNLSVRSGPFREAEGFSSRWPGSSANPRTATPRRGGPLAQSRRLLHLGRDGDGGGVVLSAENEARCRRVLRPNAALYEREKEKARGGEAQRGGEGQRDWAAVLVSLCSVQGEPAFLFTLRSRTLKGRHKGDVSFAGGKQDRADRDVVDTALREAREELGVTVAASSVWGTLKPMRDLSGMLIAPVLANLGPLEAMSFRPNPAEVEEIFTVSLAHMCSPENRGYTNYRVGDRYGYTTPVFLNAKHRVWGLTAVALDHALKVVVPPPR